MQCHNNKVQLFYLDLVNAHDLTTSKLKETIYIHTLICFLAKTQMKVLLESLLVAEHIAPFKPTTYHFYSFFTLRV